ncbi:hypothetical protein HOY82DRAFT_617356 [Tuber indicum]|nr:hypothetical protein HOY82DRAFT_617356 [Tuber indicum]
MNTNTSHQGPPNVPLASPAPSQHVLGSTQWIPQAAPQQTQVPASQAMAAQSGARAGNGPPLHTPASIPAQAANAYAGSAPMPPVAPPIPARDGTPLPSANPGSTRRARDPTARIRKARARTVAPNPTVAPNALERRFDRLQGAASQPPPTRYGTSLQPPAPLDTSYLASSPNATRGKTPDADFTFEELKEDPEYFVKAPGGVAASAGGRVVAYQKVGFGYRALVAYGPPRFCKYRIRPVFPNVQGALQGPVGPVVPGVPGG